MICDCCAGAMARTPESPSAAFAASGHSAGTLSSAAAGPMHCQRGLTWISRRSVRFRKRGGDRKFPMAGPGTDDMNTCRVKLFDARGRDIALERKLTELPRNEHQQELSGPTPPSRPSRSLPHVVDRRSGQPVRKLRNIDVSGESTNCRYLSARVIALYGVLSARRGRSEARYPGCRILQQDHDAANAKAIAERVLALDPGNATARELLE